MRLLSFRGFTFIWLCLEITMPVQLWCSIEKLTLHWISAIEYSFTGQETLPVLQKETDRVSAGVQNSASSDRRKTSRR